jgi:hypothetical protein
LRGAREIESFDPWFSSLLGGYRIARSGVNFVTVEMIRHIDRPGVAMLGSRARVKRQEQLIHGTGRVGKTLQGFRWR